MINRIKNARNDGDGVKGAEKKEDHTWQEDDQLQHVTSEVACFHRLVRVMPVKCQTNMFDSTRKLHREHCQW